MTIAFVQSVSISSAGETTAINTTGATLIVAASGSYSAAFTMSDSKSNSYSYLNTYTGPDVLVRIAYCMAPVVSSGSADHTFTLSGSYASMTVAAFSGTDQGAWAETQNGANNVPDPGSITTDSDGQLIIYAGGLNTYAPSWDITGYSIIRREYANGVAQGTAFAYKVQTVAGTETPTVIEPWGIKCSAIASFAPPGAGAGPAKRIIIQAVNRAGTY